MASAGEPVGVWRLSRTPTDMYTVITGYDGSFRTVYPGYAAGWDNEL